MKTPNPDHPIRNTLARLALASTMGAAMYFGASPASAEPPVTAGLKLHLDASQLTGLSDGATVTTWTDMSGNGNNATAAATPIYKAGALNGEPVIRFSNPQWANNASFTTADLSSQFPTAATLFIVATINDYSYTLVDTNANTDTDEWWSWHGDSKSAPAVFRSSRLDRYCDIPQGSQLFAISSSASAWKMSINGTSQGVEDGQYNAGGPLVVGNDSNGRSFNGDIAEILIYDSVLTTTEANQVGSYLARKYALTTAYPPLPLAVKLTSPANALVIPSGTSVTASATCDEWWIRQSAFVALADAAEDPSLAMQMLPHLRVIYLREGGAQAREYLAEKMRFLSNKHKPDSEVGKTITAIFKEAVAEIPIEPGFRSGVGGHYIYNAIEASLNYDPMTAFEIAKLVKDRLEDFRTDYLELITKAMLACRDKLPESQKNELTEMLYQNYRRELILRMEKGDLQLDLIASLLQLKDKNAGWHDLGTPVSSERTWKFTSFEPLEKDFLHPREERRFREVTLPAEQDSLSQKA